MSGGSMDYLHWKVESARFNADTPLKCAFYMHLQKVAKAMKAIEWHESGDTDGEDVGPAIMDCVNSELVLEAGIKQAESAIKQLQEAMRIAVEMKANDGR